MSNVTALSDAFAAILRDWLSADDWRAMQAKNAKPEYAGPICASHDYCDANMAMDAAFTACEGRDVGLQRDADLALWNSAWSDAKARHLTA